MAQRTTRHTVENTYIWNFEHICKTLAKKPPKNKENLVCFCFAARHISTQILAARKYSLYFYTYGRQLRNIKYYLLNPFKWDYTNACELHICCEQV